jgi:tetratricopeptide (TPR) repeat protein
MGCANKYDNTKYKPYQKFLEAEPLAKYTDQINDEPKNYLHWLNRSRVALDQKLYEIAILDAEQAWNKNSLLETAENYIDIVNNIEADSTQIPVLQSINKKFVGNMAFQRCLQSVFFNLKKYDEALTISDSLFNLLKASPSVDAYTLYYNDKASILAQKGDTTEAITNYNAALQYDPLNNDVKLNLLELYAGKASPEAMPLANELILIQKEKTPSDVYYLKALYLLKKNELADALKNIDAAIEKDINSPDNWLLKIQICKQANRLPDAENTAAKATSLFYQDATVWLEQAKVLVLVNKKTEAKASLEKVLNLDPNLAEAKTLQASL